MRIAIFTDIHGNPLSTRAVLDAISDNGFFNAIVLAGDTCFGGSDSADCIDMVRAAIVQMVYGNEEEFVFSSLEEPPSEAYRARWSQTYRESRWAEAQLGEYKGRG